jgi:uncharacterized Ntn-hydrolase superfamily protein
VTTARRALGMTLLTLAPVPPTTAGVGVVATQSFVDPGYRPRGLALLRAGTSAPEALKQLVAADPAPEGRQVAILDATGRVSAYTGKTALAAAGHVIGDGVSAQANLMGTAAVWPAMLKAYESGHGDLADRLFDLRVEDHPAPVAELKRLVRFQRAYTHANRGDELMSEKKVDDALREYRSGSELAPEVLELAFMHAVTLASVGREAEATPIFRAVFAKEPQWVELLGRLPAAALFPDDAALLGRIRALARRP